MTRSYSDPLRSAVKCPLEPASRSAPDRPAAVSQSVLRAATEEAEARDLRKDSCTSTDDVIAIVDEFRRIEAAEKGRNSLARLPALSKSTKRNVVMQVAPVKVPNRGVQNSQRALMDSGNALSCAASWPVVSAGISNGKFLHSWDECSVMLNSFNEKQTLRCSVKGRRSFSQLKLSHKEEC